MIESIRKWKFSIMLVLMVAIFAYVVNGLGNQQDQTDELVVQSINDEIEDDYNTCLTRVDLRNTMYGLLDAVVEGSVPLGVFLDLAQVVGFENLDTETQTYLANLDAFFDAGNDDPGAIAQIRDDYKANNPIPDCEAERRASQRQLNQDAGGD